MTAVPPAPVPGPLVARDPDCPAGCADEDGTRHHWHLLRCDSHGCHCAAPPIPGITL